MSGSLVTKVFEVDQAYSTWELFVFLRKGLACRNAASSTDWCRAFQTNCGLPCMNWTNRLILIQEQVQLIMGISRIKVISPLPVSASRTRKDATIFNVISNVLKQLWQAEWRGVTPFSFYSRGCNQIIMIRNATFSYSISCQVSVPTVNLLLLIQGNSWQQGSKVQFSLSCKLKVWWKVPQNPFGK